MHKGGGEIFSDDKKNVGESKLIERFFPRVIIDLVSMTETNTQYA